jgi:hypothetical protein
MSNHRAFDKRPKRPAAIGPADPAAWYRMNNAIIGVEQAWRKFDAKWGVGRLVCLVSDDTRERMRLGMDQWQIAIAQGNDTQVVELAPKVRGALAFMDAEAEAAGEAPLAPEVWGEARLEDGPSWRSSVATLMSMLSWRPGGRSRCGPSTRSLACCRTQSMR